MCGFTDYCSETGGAPPFHIEGQIAKSPEALNPRTTGSPRFTSPQEPAARPNRVGRGCATGSVLVALC